MTGCGRESLQDVREWLGGLPVCPGVVEMPSRMYGSGREALPDDRVWSGVSSGCPGVVGRPSRISGCGIAPEFLRVVGRSFRMSRSSRESFPDVWEWS